jgi:hypothetical protein
VSDHEAVQAVLDELGITFTSEFVPQSRSWTAREKRPHLNWRVAIQVHGKDVTRMEYSDDPESLKLSDESAETGRDEDGNTIEPPDIPASLAYILADYQNDRCAAIQKALLAALGTCGYNRLVAALN